MDWQTAFNIALGLAGALGGFMLHALWQAVKDLQGADKDLSEKVHSIEKLVAGHYVTREEFKQVVDALFKKLDRIDERMTKQ